MKSNKIIEVRNITKTYKNKGVKKVVLDNISFDIEENDRIAFIGENGCGKTTLVSIIVGFKSKDSGSVYYNEKIIDKEKQVGIQFQKETYPRGINVKDVLEFYSEIYDIEFNDQQADLLKKFGLLELLNVEVRSLSGGQQQRLMALLSIICDPKLVIIDELSNNLDIRIKEAVLDSIKEYILKNNKTLLLVSHNYEEIKNLCNRIIAINKGKIILDTKLKPNASIEEIKKIFTQTLPYQSTHQNLSSKEIKEMIVGKSKGENVHG